MGLLENRIAGAFVLIPFMTQKARHEGGTQRKILSEHDSPFTKDSRNVW